jgi:hypothetical protein
LLVPQLPVVQDDLPVRVGVGVAVAAVVIGVVELIQADCGLSTVIVNVETAVEGAGKCGVTDATFIQRLEAKFIAPGDIVSFWKSILVMMETHR